MLSHEVYVGGINNLSDARYAAGMFVDWIGLPIGGEFGLSETKINEIVGWLSGVRMVGQIQGIPDFDVAALPFDAFEVSTQVQYQWVKSRINAPIGWRTHVQHRSTIPSDIDFLVLEGASPADIVTDSQTYWELHPELIEQEVWLQYPEMKLSLQGGMEERPGFSNFGNLIEILEALELD